MLHDADCWCKRMLGGCAGGGCRTEEFADRGLALNGEAGFVHKL
jgi:hypothetical protein